MWKIIKSTLVVLTVPEQALGNITEKSISLYICTKSFSLIWKPNGTSFNQALEELNRNFKVFYIVKSDKHSKSFLEKKYDPKKVPSPLTNTLVTGLKPYDKDRAVPFCICIYKLNEFSGEYAQDMSEKGNQKGLNDCVVFNRSDCVNEMLDHVL